MKFEITSGQIVKPQKCVIFGPEGIGKTTFAAQFPTPLFIDTEDGSNIYNVARLPKPSSWQMLLEEIWEIKQNPNTCETLVIDTLDRAEQLCIEHVCAAHNKKGIEEFGYGNGYVYVKEEFGRMLNMLSDVINVGVNVVLTANAQLINFEQPNEQVSYDRYELKLGKKTSSQTAPLVKEWSDMLLFANYKVITMAANKEGTKAKAFGGERVIYTTHHPNWDAKNRHDLAEELPFDFKSIASCIPLRAAKATVATPEPAKVETPKTEPLKAAEPPKAEPVKTEKKDEPATFKMPANMPNALADLMATNKVTLDELQKAVTFRGIFPEGTPFENYPDDFVQGCLIGAWAQVYKIIEDEIRIPF